MMMSPNKPELKELFDGLNSYLTYGYVNELSPEDPAKDAFDYLNALYLANQHEGLVFCKLILESEILYNDFLRSTCLSYLLLSESDWQYSFSFLLENSKALSVPLLKEALFYFYCAKNETDPYPVPDGLFKKLMARYEELKDDPDAKFYHLHETYNDFLKSYSLNN
ncbi:hypothetical protein U1R68_11125 [Pectobacterium colocasium]|uniref:hypothetical protein n=1 Tax=Pectobacterium colocasium TaxID=2878098 RepID=UPI001CD6BF2A|nr:hypothetical protein [Pectobacterium colocasium]